MTSGRRLLLLVLLIAALLLLGHFLGASEHLTRERVRTLMLDLGALGFLLYLALFAIGELLHVPGMVFVAAAILAYGRWPGLLAGLLGSLVSVSVTFFIVRSVGGQPLGAIRSPWFKRVLGRLEERPIAVVAALRALLWLTPALNYTLAMSRVSYRDYLAGSALGLLPPLFAAALLFDWLFS